MLVSATTNEHGMCLDMFMPKPQVLLKTVENHWKPCRKPWENVENRENRREVRLSNNKEFVERDSRRFSRFSTFYHGFRDGFQRFSTVFTILINKTRMASLLTYCASFLCCFGYMLNRIQPMTSMSHSELSRLLPCCMLSKQNQQQHVFTMNRVHSSKRPFQHCNATNIPTLWNHHCNNTKKMRKVLRNRSTTNATSQGTVHGRNVATKLDVRFLFLSCWVWCSFVVVASMLKPPAQCWMLRSLHGVQSQPWVSAAAAARQPFSTLRLLLEVAIFWPSTVV